MPDVKRDGWRVHYEAVGPADGEPVVLLAGLGEQIGSVEFPDEHCAALADAGFRAIRIDNRDNGMSVPDADPGDPDWVAIITATSSGAEPPVPYPLGALAEDVVAVLDDARIEAATLLAASMGTAVARWVAVRHPDRVRALMLVTGVSGAAAGEGGPVVADEIIGRLMGMTVRRERAEAVAYVVDLWRSFWGSAYPFDEPWVRTRVEASFDRSYRPEGVGRNMAAMVPTGLWDAQRTIACPTLVMHGGQDECCPPEHGRAIAERIAGSTLWEVPGMGHTMHRELWAEMTSRLTLLTKPQPP